MLNEHRILHPVVNRPVLELALEELGQVLRQPPRTLADFVNAFSFNGGGSVFQTPIKAFPIFRTTNTSGFNYSLETKMLAYLRFGVTTTGYFVIQSLILDQNSEWVSHYYTADGKYSFSEGPISHYFASHPEISMETHCPILNHLYNILSEDYIAANQGKINTKRDHTIELALRRLEKTRKNELSVSRRSKDEAIQNLNLRMTGIETDPIYTWKERFQIYKGLKAERSAIIQTKRRAHRKSLLQYGIPIFISDAVAAAYRFTLRPYNNFLGVLDRMFIDPIRWFLRMVKSNLGLSIAMAIYSPFTFFFISQPMNPHATWAVGKVRSAYLDMTNSVQGWIDHPTVHTAQAVTVTSNLRSKNAVPNPFLLVSEKDKTKEDFGIRLSTDTPAIDQQTWDERMSNFKAMQISYESNVEAASRFGRLEQMETQLNWPLHIESAWLATEKYLSFLNYLESTSNDYQPGFAEYVKAEKFRTEQTEFYLWDRNVRFILDHPYTMMNESNEQAQDFFIGRAFLMLRDMTQTLVQRHKSMKQPAGFDQIMKLAQQFEQDYKTDGGILQRLKKNSKLFAQDDPLNTNELRTYMKRQWEILYLLQNRAQEGANNALSMYIWSVRNAVWLVQSIYTTKEADLRAISFALKKGAAGTTAAAVNKLSADPAFKHTESQYEALFHMMVLEYTSIRKEIGEALQKDVEANQRKTLIDGMESFFKEREALLKGANLL